MDVVLNRIRESTSEECCITSPPNKIHRLTSSDIPSCTNTKEYAIEWKHMFSRDSDRWHWLVKYQHIPTHLHLLSVNIDVWVAMGCQVCSFDQKRYRGNGDDLWHCQSEWKVDERAVQDVGYNCQPYCIFWEQVIIPRLDLCLWLTNYDKVVTY